MPIPNTSHKSVIINADDLGLSSAINHAVVQLAEKQRINASSFMSGGQISQEHIQALQQCNIHIGLHLDFTGIFPSPLRQNLSSLIISSYLKQLNSQQVQHIIAKQLDHFETCFQKHPDFIDGHQHIHQLPIIRQALLAELNQRYPHQPIYARTTQPLTYHLKSWIIYMLGGRSWQKLCQQHHIPTNPYFAGVYNFQADLSKLKKLWQQWFNALPISTPSTPIPTIIMCHPAIEDNNWSDEIKTARELEYHWLMSNEFQDLLTQHQIQLNHCLPQSRWLSSRLN